MQPDKYSGPERREYTPVEIRHLAPGTRIAAIGLFIVLVGNLVGTGMAYQKLVDSTNRNSQDIQAIRSVDIQLMEAINDMTRAVASLTATVQHLAEDIDQLEDDVRARP